MDIIRRDTNSKTCPKGYRKLDANGLCIKSERIKEGSFELPPDFKKCPKGFLRKPKTRQCLKATKRKGKATLKKTVKKPPAKKPPAKKLSTEDLVELAVNARKCPQGYSRVKGTRKCRKRTAGPVKTMKKKATPPKGVPMPPGAKRCPKGSKRIPGTDLCQPTTKTGPAKATKLEPAKATQTKVPTPPPPYDLGAVLSEATSSPSKKVLRTRSPSVNKFLGTRRTPALPFCPARIGDYEVGSEKHPNKIWVRTKGGGAEWVGWSTKAAKEYMLQQFLSNAPIDCSIVRGPNQYFSNCWFNTFFMVFFVSDKGRRTFRYVRNAMITGEFPPTDKKVKKLVPRPYRKGLFYLNALIQNSLHGALPKLYDTNSVVKALNSASSKVGGKAIFPKLRQYSNPLTFYLKLINALEGTNTTNRVKLATINAGVKVLTHLKSTFPWIDSPSSWHQRLYEYSAQYAYDAGKDVMPDFIAIEMAELADVSKEHEGTAKWWTTEGKKKWGFHGYGHKDGDSSRFQLKGKDGKKYIYELDSLVSRDTTKQHFACFLTCNKTEYVFDGACSTRISPLNWKRQARDHAPRTLLQRKSTGLKFDLLRNYNISFFYRVE